MKYVALGRYAVALALVSLSSLTVLRHSGHACRTWWCVQPATRHFQDGPNAVEFPTYYFCDACYDRFVARRAERSQHADPLAGEQLVGNRLFDEQELRAARCRKPGSRGWRSDERTSE